MWAYLIFSIFYISHAVKLHLKPLFWFPPSVTSSNSSVRHAEDAGPGCTVTIETPSRFVNRVVVKSEKGRDPILTGLSKGCESLQCACQKHTNNGGETIKTSARRLAEHNLLSLIFSSVLFGKGLVGLKINTSASWLWGEPRGWRTSEGKDSGSVLTAFRESTAPSKNWRLSDSDRERTVNCTVTRKLLYS